MSNLTQKTQGTCNQRAQGPQSFSQDDRTICTLRTKNETHGGNETRVETAGKAKHQKQATAKGQQEITQRIKTRLNKMNSGNERNERSEQ